VAATVELFPWQHDLQIACHEVGHHKEGKEYVFSPATGALLPH